MKNNYRINSHYNNLVFHWNIAQEMQEEIEVEMAIHNLLKTKTPLTAKAVQEEIEKLADAEERKLAKLQPKKLAKPTLIAKKLESLNNQQRIYPAKDKVLSEHSKKNASRLAKKEKAILKRSEKTLNFGKRMLPAIVKCDHQSKILKKRVVAKAAKKRTQADIDKSKLTRKKKQVVAKTRNPPNYH
jgi:hypothetical protein